MMADYRQRHKAYREEKSRWDSLGKKKSDTPEPEMPPLKMFLIAGNNSGTGVLENLIEADGIGLICETEADTVSTAIGTEHGHWSDTLRKCHDHERLAFNRRTNREYRECPASYLSVLLSGTPAQVRPLIPSAENGLFSRQLFYRMPPIDEWADQFEQGDEDMDSLFSDWGRQWKKLVDYRHAKGAIQQLLRTHIRARRSFLRLSDAKLRGPYCHQYLPDRFRGGLPAIGGESPHPTSHSRFSIFNSQLSRSLACPRDPGGERTGRYRSFPRVTHQR